MLCLLLIRTDVSALDVFYSFCLVYVTSSLTFAALLLNEIMFPLGLVYRNYDRKIEFILWSVNRPG